MKNTLINNSRSSMMILLLIILMIYISSCKKLIEVDAPINAIVGPEIYKSDVTAASVLTGMYAELSTQNFQNLSLNMGTYGDELVSIAPPGTLVATLYQNALSNQGDQLFWPEYYKTIFRANSAIEGLNASTTLTQSVKSRLLGEAKFIRAFMYFYLVNMYGNVPLITTTDVQSNRAAPRVSQAEVYQQIIADLKDAQERLSNDYLKADMKSVSGERLRPNKGAATALLARVYLFTQNWELAEIEASKVIADSKYQLESLSTVFLSISKEAIWQLQPTVQGENTKDAIMFVLKPTVAGTLPGPDGNRPVYLSTDFYNHFEIGDHRKLTWTDTVQIVEPGTGKILQIYPFPFKYKAWIPLQPRTEYIMAIRLGELFLIRAEARARLGNLSLSASDINEIRRRAGLSNISFTSLDDALSNILKEGRSEMFTEFGYRWFTLKRAGKLQEVMSVTTPSKGGVWQAYKALLPLPLLDLRNNPNLREGQNPGYPSY